jgi:hypothetical protein
MHDWLISATRTSDRAERLTKFQHAKVQESLTAKYHLGREFPLYVAFDDVIRLVRGPGSTMTGVCLSSVSLLTVLIRTHTSLTNSKTPALPKMVDPQSTNPGAA